MEVALTSICKKINRNIDAILKANHVSNLTTVYEIALCLNKRMEKTLLNRFSKLSLRRKLRKFISTLKGFRSHPNETNLKILLKTAKDLQKSLLDMMVASESNIAYITNTLSNSVSILDATQPLQSPLPTFKTQQCPKSLTISPDNLNLFIPNTNTSNPGKVTLYNTTTAKITTFNVGNNPCAVAVSNDNNTFYTVNSGSRTVTVITNLNQKTIKTLPVGSSPRNIALTPDGTKAYIVNAGSRSVTVIDTTRNQVISTIAVGNNPQALTMSPDGTVVYVANAGEKTVSIIHTSDDTPITVPKLNLMGNPINIIFVQPNENQNLAYITTKSSNSIAVVDVATKTIVDTIIINSPTIMVATPDQTRIYVARSTQNKVSVISTLTNKVIKDISVDGSPSWITITGNGDLVVVTLSNSNQVQVISTSTNTIIDTQSVGKQPRYVTTMRGNPRN
ncbi:YncE family protein [Hazenella sp. IB182357]|uniref:YncE family protein n=1 Tax=Polycladospora coralii TaxID=2771432 RepID=A0A926RTC4_9BACL|nr:YncE family protein [Polycladospora coralii]MBD1372645.1 YncE family protein [Polycladospora coralii]MBS7531247.1 YncE family protein [Polycladospora coralii]